MILPWLGKKDSDNNLSSDFPCRSYVFYPLTTGDSTVCTAAYSKQIKMMDGTVEGQIIFSETKHITQS